MQVCGAADAPGENNPAPTRALAPGATGGTPAVQQAAIAADKCAVFLLHCDHHRSKNRCVQYVVTRRTNQRKQGIGRMLELGIAYGGAQESR